MKKLAVVQMRQVIDDAEKRGIVELFEEHGFVIEISRGMFRWTKYSKSEIFAGRVTIDHGDHLGGADRYRTVNAAIEHLRTHQFTTATGDSVRFTPDREGLEHAIVWVKEAIGRP